MLLLTVHLVAVSALAGLSWVVQLVVYPAFLLVGETSAWRAFHDAHGRAMAQVVALPWAVQGATLAVLLLGGRPAGVPLVLVLLAAALGAATVLVTVVESVPLHGRLAEYDRARRPPAGAHARPAHRRLDRRHRLRRSDAPHGHPLTPCPPAATT